MWPNFQKGTSLSHKIILIKCLPSISGHSANFVQSILSCNYNYYTFNYDSVYVFRSDSYRHGNEDNLLPSCCNQVVDWKKMSIYENHRIVLVCPESTSEGNKLYMQVRTWDLEFITGVVY